MDINALIKTGQEVMTTFGIKILAAIAILVIGRWVAKLLVHLLKRGMERSKLDVMLASFVANMTYAALMVFVALAAINQVGIQTTSFVAIIGAAGLAVGLALQGSLANFAAGVLLILFRPYKVGDYVEGAGKDGTVKDVQIFTTTLLTPDNKTIIVPNGQMMNGVITNYSTNDTRRVDLVAGVAYGDDLDKVREVLNEIVTGDERVLAEPPPRIAVHELADSSVNFIVRPWVKTSDYWAVYWDMTEQIKKRFDDKGISIPFPQRDVHLYQHAGH